MKIYTSSIFTIILAICGGLLILIAVYSGGASILLLIKRLQYGRSILFADVEFLGIVAFICALTGGLAILAAKLLSRYK